MSNTNVSNYRGTCLGRITAAWPFTFERLQAQMNSFVALSVMGVTERFATPKLASIHLGVNLRMLSYINSKRCHKCTFGFATFETSLLMMKVNVSGEHSVIGTDF